MKVRSLQVQAVAASTKGPAERKLSRSGAETDVKGIFTPISSRLSISELSTSPMNYPKWIKSSRLPNICVDAPGGLYRVEISSEITNKGGRSIELNDLTFLIGQPRFIRCAPRIITNAFLRNTITL